MQDSKQLKSPSKKISKSCICTKVKGFKEKDSFKMNGGFKFWLQIFIFKFVKHWNFGYGIGDSSDELVYNIKFYD